jgi:hypothetical protein
MPFDDEGTKRLGCILLGGVIGAALVQNHHDESRKSRAEKDDPEGVEWLLLDFFRNLDGFDLVTGVDVGGVAILATDEGRGKEQYQEEAGFHCGFTHRTPHATANSLNPRLFEV